MISNEEVLRRMKIKESVLYNSIVKQKLAFAGHVLRGSSGDNAVQILEGKLDGKIAQGRPRRMWIDDIKDWTNLDSYASIKRAAEDRINWRACTRMACRPSITEDDS